MASQGRALMTAKMHAKMINSEKARSLARAPSARVDFAGARFASAIAGLLNQRPSARKSKAA